MKILVRLPNWLGDMVMSIGFLNALRQAYPDASISVIAKKGIDELLEFIPGLDHQFIFSKDEYRGLKGAWKFGRMIRKTARFDLFFCLPDSFSSALIAFATGAKQRIGYQKELRGIFLTHAYKRAGAYHRVNEYINLVNHFTNKQFEVQEIFLKVKDVLKKNSIIVNINSEASSRRLPFQKAIQLLQALQQSTRQDFILIGGKKDQDFVTSVFDQLPEKNAITNLAGKTSLSELVHLLASSKIILTTDSGPAHLANALGVFTVVLNGAGNEFNTAPFNEQFRKVIRLGQLPCEPCVKNTCVLFGVPKCLVLLDNQLIVEEVLRHSI